MKKLFLCIFLISKICLANELPDLGDYSETVIGTHEEGIIGTQILQQVYQSDSVINDVEIEDYLYNLTNKLVKSSDYYGHDPRLIEVGIKEEIGGLITQGERVRFRGRLQFVKVGGVPYLVLPINHNLGDGYLDRLVVVENSGLALLRLTGEGFEKAFETSKVKGFLGTFRVIPHKNGAGVYVLRVDKSLINKAAFSTLSTYEWPAR